MIKHRSLNNWIGFIIALLIVTTTIWVSNALVHKLRTEEQKKVEIIVRALELQSSDLNLSTETRDLILKITQENTTIPLLLVGEEGDYSFQKNMDEIEEQLSSDSIFLQKKINELSEKHAPIEVNLPFGKNYIYYENSSLLNQLRYYPLVLIGIILLFVIFTLWYFRQINSTQKSFLWAGMAKETAHQIGTPLSSLIGWLELLKLENVNPEAIDQMDSDIQRLNQIAERFSKIGSIPELKKIDLVKTLEASHLYLKDRLSQKIEFSYTSTENSIFVMGNEQLLSWVVENLTKNAVDAMQNKGQLHIMLQTDKNYAFISVTDTGSGIPKHLQKRIFEPGFTTKKRGWGLGLSLAKRIIKDYHSGKIMVEDNPKSQGTRFTIRLNKIKNAT